MLSRIAVVVALAWSAIQGPPDVLPSAATTKLRDSLQAAASHKSHLWRDTPAFDGTLVNAYIEIPFGERNKYEFNMATNTRAIDRVIPEAIGGYPVNYGIVPQTIGWDGDPFDALVLGPPLARGTLTSGVILGLMSMEDEKGLDSKVVLSAVGDDGRPRYALTAAERDRIADYFSRYKRHEPGKFSKVHGWGTAAEGRAFVEMTNAFFRRCTKQANADCRLDR